jgi:VanZ family protein
MSQRRNETLNSEASKKQPSLWDFIPVPYLGATIGYCAFLYYLSSVSSFPVESPFEFFDKIVHFCLYSGLSATVAIGLQQARHKYSPSMLIIIPVGFSALYGVIDEIHQLFVPLRDFAFGDMAADAIGATVAAAFLLVFYRWRNARK